MINERLNSFILAREERVVPPERESSGVGEMNVVASPLWQQRRIWSGMKGEKGMRS